MSFKYLDSWTVYYHTSNTQKAFSSFEEAVKAAEAYVGNSSYNQPFPKEPYTRLYGPGNGDTSVMIRRDAKFE